MVCAQHACPCAKPFPATKLLCLYIIIPSIDEIGWAPICVQLPDK